MEEKLSYRNTVRLFAGEKCFGPGVAQLLRHVQEFHSLRSAAKAMNMAYSKAWTIVKSSERILGVQLLHTSVGGRSGGGAQLTEEAVLLLEAYTAFCADLHAAGTAKSWRRRWDAGVSPCGRGFTVRRWPTARRGHWTPARCA